MGLALCNHEIKNATFDKYLELYGYKFNCKLNEIGGYALIKDNKSQIIMDVGRPPEKKFSQSYQSGALSFEFSYLNNKIITNSGMDEGFALPSSLDILIINNTKN